MGPRRDPQQVAFGGSLFSDISSLEDGIANFMGSPDFNVRKHLKCSGDHKVEMQLDEFFEMLEKLVKDTLLSLGWCPREETILISKRLCEGAISDSMEIILSAVVGIPYQVSVDIQKARSRSGQQLSMRIQATQGSEG